MATLATQDTESTAGQRELVWIRAARACIADLFEINATVYWIDLLVTSLLWWAAAAMLLAVSWHAVWTPISFFVAAMAGYRLACFNHELAHLRRREFILFRAAWNSLFGIPTLMPCFLYDTHLDHHRIALYGTDRDGEYLPMGCGSRWPMLIYIAQIPLVPLLAVIRFGLLTPLSFIHPRFRRYVVQRASSMVISPSYERRLDPPPVDGRWLVEEWCCFAVVVGVAIAILAGFIPSIFFLKIYLLAVFILVVNTLRTLAAHRYQHRECRLSHEQQLLDSVNLEGPAWLLGLLAPLGLRYHALHHLFPAIPYHSLHRAHNRLLEKLPPDSPYRQTQGRILPILRDLWRATSGTRVAVNGLAPPDMIDDL